MELTLNETLHKAVEAHRAGQIQEADRLYTAMLQDQPKHPDVNHNMGVLAVGADKIQEALLFFKTALEANPGKGQYWLSYIDALIQLDQIADAQTVLDQAKGKGASGEAFEQREQRLNELNEAQVKADPHIDGQNQVRPNVLDSLKLDQAIRLAKKKAKEGSPDDVKHIYNDILARFPKNKRALDGIKSLSGGFIGKVSKVQEPPQELLGSLLEHYQNRRFSEAETLAISLTQQFPAHQFGWKVLGAVLKQTGRIIDSLTSMQKSVQLVPQDAEAHYNLGITLKELGRLDEAEESYTQAIALKPDYAGAHNNLGTVLKELGRLDEAEASYTQSIALKPDLSDAHYNLGITLQELGRLDEAEVSYTQAIAFKPDYAEAYSNLGSMLKKLGRLEEAKASYKQAIAFKPDYAEAHNNFGATLQELGRLDEAEASYTQAVVLKPDYTEAHNNLGATLQELGRLDEAEASYTQAIALKPDFAKAHYNLGVLLFESRKYNLAEEQFGISDTYQGKLYAIRCSYLQDEEVIFYEKFDLLVCQGEINAVMGSLAFCSESKYGTKKSNPFCNDPLKYVVKTDLNELYDFGKIFIETVKDVLTDNSVSYKAQGHLTNGIQTAGNIFAQGKVPKTEIENIIHTEIEKYRIQFKNSEEGFIKNWPTSYEIKGWVVSMQSGGKLAPHMHDNGWITGSIYINVPPKSKTDCGNLVLCISDQEHVLGVEKNQQSIIDVVTGSLCLFPSSLHHYTVPFEEKENRIVLAFDVHPKN